MDRRSFLLASAATAVPTATMSATAPADPQRELDAILAIADHTGLSLDDLFDWLDGVDVERIAVNVAGATVRKWEAAQTHAVFVGYAAGEKLAGGPFPIRGYIQRQLILKGHVSTMQRNVAIYGADTMPEFRSIIA